MHDLTHRHGPEHFAMRSKSEFPSRVLSQVGKVAVELESGISLANPTLWKQPIYLR